MRLEEKELKADPKGELRELAQIYRERGLDADLAMKVAQQLSMRDRLGAHLRDELGLTSETRAQPLQAAARVGRELRVPRGDPHSCAPRSASAAADRRHRHGVAREPRGPGSARRLRRWGTDAQGRPASRCRRRCGDGHHRPDWPSCWASPAPAEASVRCASVRQPRARELDTRACAAAWHARCCLVARSPRSSRARARRRSTRRMDRDFVP